MPNGPCPYGHETFDWHREWWTNPEQRELYQKKFATDCPLCAKRVWLGAGPEQIDQDTPRLKRSRAAAEEWVRREKSQYADLDTYLQSGDPTAGPYEKYVFREDQQNP
jgi:hypothetical protein